MILYFSATGNSEYIAYYLGHLLDDKVINITKYLKDGTNIDLTSEKPYVVISPIYLSTIPTIVYKKLINANLKGNKNIYFIMTCAGSGVSASAYYLKKITKKLNLTYKGVSHLSMPQDYLIFFKVENAQQNEIKMDKAIAQVPSIANKIINNENLDMKKVGIMHILSIKPVELIFNKSCIRPKKFYATNSCIGCSLCSKVCPLNNITMVDKKPCWNKNCIHCTACINHCPKKAIEYGKKTVSKNRYVAKKFRPTKSQ